jgi:hypothetical protein
VQANTSLKYGLKSDLFFVEQKKSATRFLFFSKKGKGVVIKREAMATSRGL